MPNTTGVKTYASLLHNLHSPQPVLSNPIRPSINKDQEIVVRLNSSEKKAILKDISTDIILKDMSTSIRSKKHRSLGTVKRLPSRDFLVLTVNNEEAEVLRGGARVPTRTYGIMINGVKVEHFDMTNTDYAIENIKASNTDIKGLQKMNIKWIGWKSVFRLG